MAASRKQIEALYRDRYLGFRRALASVTGSYETAHDVVQEAFARAIAERGKFRGDAPLGAWVWKIAVELPWMPSTVGKPVEPSPGSSSRSPLDHTVASQAEKSIVLSGL